MAASDDIADYLVRHRVDLLRSSEAAIAAALLALEELSRDVAAAIAEIDVGGVRRNYARRARLEKLKRRIDAVVRAKYNAIASGDAAFRREIASIEAAAAVAAVNTTIGAVLAQPRLSLAQLRVLADDVLVEGAVVREWWAKESRDTREAFVREMRLGLSAGETIDQLTRRVLGDPIQPLYGTLPDGSRGVIASRAGGVLQSSRRRARALVRTGTLAVSNAVLFESFKANNDIVRGVQALVTLDTRTSDICKARSGMAWELDTNYVIGGVNV